MDKTNTKPFAISKNLVVKAYELVKANKGCAGVDQETLKDFDKNLKDNLYKIWNRLSSGSYFPPAVKAVSIPKKSKGERILGIPTVSDRIAQMVVKLILEPKIEPFFHPDSHGYRPTKSALEAVGKTRQRCWKYDWVLEFDIKGLFDNIDHTLLMKAVHKHTDSRWCLLYIERWLKAPLLQEGTLIERRRGTPQGGVISPLLSNLFLHYTFDLWMQRKYPHLEWCRYADDGLVHCKTEKEARELLHSLEKRFKECGLELHPDKTKIVYCKDDRRRQLYPNTKFTFLGFEFRRRKAYNQKQGKAFLGFTPAMSKEAGQSVREKIRKLGIRKQTQWDIKALATLLNPMIRGWIGYYGKYNPWDCQRALRYVDQVLAIWARKKFKKLRRNKSRAYKFLNRTKAENPELFIHWKVYKTKPV